MTRPVWTPPAAPAEVLEWGPVRLARWRAEDVDEAFAAVDRSREHLARFLPWSRDYEHASAASYVETSDTGWAERTAFNYRICAEGIAAGRVLGSASLMARRGADVLEIGYWVRSDVVRRGLAWRASAALTEAAFAVAPTAEIWICHDPANQASAGIPARLGYTRQAESVPGPPGFEHERDVCWTLSKKDWVPVRG